MLGLRLDFSQIVVPVQQHLEGLGHDLVNVNQLLIQLVKIFLRIHIFKLFFLLQDHTLYVETNKQGQTPRSA